MSTIGFFPRVTPPQRATWHAGPGKDFLRRWEAEVAYAIETGGRDALESIHPQILATLADERNLMLAWQFLSRYGGQAPGPNGDRYADYSVDEVWSGLRRERDRLLDGGFERRPLRSVSVPKSSGNGVRQLSLPNIQDRVVLRGIKQVLEPLFDPFMDERSHGFRPYRGRLTALNAVERCSLDENRLVWVTADVRDAFNQVPRGRLKDVLARHVPDDIAELVVSSSRAETKRGIIQGGSLSPLLLNIYLDHFIDQPWRKHFRDVPNFRSADDLLLCCRSVSQAQEALGALERRLQTVRMPLKEGSRIVDLPAGDHAEWLGFRIGHASGRLTVRLGAHALRTLGSRLERAHERPNSALLAQQVVIGWLRQAAPCFRDEDQEQVCNDVLRIAASKSFEELPGRRELLNVWEDAYEQSSSVCENSAGPGVGQFVSGR